MHRAPRFLIRLFFLTCLMTGIMASESFAKMIHVKTYALPYTAGLAQMLGDMVGVGNEAAAVFSRPEPGRLGMMFYRFGPDLSVLVERSIAPEVVNHYEPSLCWDGANFAVVSSTYNQATFMILSPLGDYILPPMQLPGLPAGVGGRTAGFRVLWTGNAYAVFGLWGEPTFPGSAYFYTHLCYWLLRGTGQVLAHKDLRVIQPLTYPGSEGYDKFYYDVVWTGAAFFVVYSSESQTGPPLSIYYKLYDLNGNVIRNEAPVFATTVAVGPAMAFSGRTIAVTALKSVTLEGNHLYVRFFDVGGTARGIEKEYGGLLGAGPTVFWDGGEFVTAYASVNPYNPSGPVWNVMLNSFDENGNRTGTEYPLADSKGKTLDGTINLAVDLKITGRGPILFGKAQASDAFIIREWPIVFLLHNDRILNYRNIFDNAAQWYNPVNKDDLLQLIRQRRQ